MTPGIYISTVILCLYVVSPWQNTKKNFGRLYCLQIQESRFNDRSYMLIPKYWYSSAR